MSDLLETHVTIAGHKRIDFDGKRVRKAMRSAGADIRKQARRLVARRAVSQAGQDPGRRTGHLYRSIKATVSRSGFMVKIRPETTAEMGDDFYPAYLFYGVTGRARRADHRAQPKDGRWRVSPRANYMEEALAARRAAVQHTIHGALLDALVPRK